MEKAEMVEEARRILRLNDRGGYCVPSSQKIYPAQWNWDSCAVALGWATFDVQRAWQEIEILLAAQWANGMVPHIVFRENDETYFPNAAFWGSGTVPATSGITQPPIAATMVRELVTRYPESIPKERLSALLQRLLRWHMWFYRERSPERDGLVALVHPWESGMDNSVCWDKPLMGVPQDMEAAGLRKDTGFVDASQRPRNEEYSRYLWLLRFYCGLGYDQYKIVEQSPFVVIDGGFNWILQRASRDLHWLLMQAGDAGGASELMTHVDASVRSMEKLWVDGDGCYGVFDVRAQELQPNYGVSPFLATLAGRGNDPHRKRVLQELEKRVNATAYPIASMDPAHEKFDAKRYWRGPSWLVANWLVQRGLDHDERERVTARRIAESSIAMVERAGFYEYFEPSLGDGLGGREFSWTAALYLDLVSR